MATKRTVEDTVKYAKDLPKFSEVVKAKRARLKDLGVHQNVHLNWDFNEIAHKNQIFRMEIDGKCHAHGGTCKKEIYLSRQELEHYARAV